MRIHSTPDGIRYTLHHERPEILLLPDTHFVSPKGGRTIVIILDSDDKPLATGVAACHPKKDNFCFKRGHQIALGRALKAYRALPARFVGTDGSVAHLPNPATGEPMTNAEVQALADEAEQGYDANEFGAG